MTTEPDPKMAFCFLIGQWHGGSRGIQCTYDRRPYGSDGAVAARCRRNLHLHGRFTFGSGTMRAYQNDRVPLPPPLISLPVSCSGYLLASKRTSQRAFCRVQRFLRPRPESAARFYEGRQ